MNGREKKSELERYLRALIDPQSATDWQMVAWDKRSPYNQHLTEMVLDNALLEVIIENLISERAIELAKDEALHDEYLKDIYEEDATRFIRGQVFNVNAPTPRPAPTGKDYSLDAAINILERELNGLREEIPDLEEKITFNKVSLSKLDEKWNKNRKEQADKFGVTLDANKDALTALGVPTSIAAINEIKNALLIPSPATVLKVNPGLVNNAVTDPKVLAKYSDVVRDLSCVFAIHELMYASNGKDTPQLNISPSLTKQLRQGKLLPSSDPLAAEAVDNFTAALSATRVVNGAESRLSYIHGKEKLLGILKDKQLASSHTSDVKVEQEHKPTTPHP